MSDPYVVTIDRTQAEAQAARLLEFLGGTHLDRLLVLRIVLFDVFNDIENREWREHALAAFIASMIHG